MPLDGYRPPTSRIRDSRAARVVITANASAADETGCQTQTARETHQEGEQDRAQHWGFSSNPPAETEGISILDQYGQRVVVSERVPCPISGFGAGASALWSGASQYCHVKSSGAVDLRCAPGQKVNLGAGATPAYPVAYSSSSESTASSVAVGQKLYDLFKQIKADLDELRAHLVSVITKANGLGVWGATVTPPYSDTPLTAPDAITTVVLNRDVNHSYVSTGSKTVETD